MPPVRLEEVDEVWLGLSEVRQSLVRDGHRPNPNPSNCHLCYALYLVVNGMEVYVERSRREQQVPSGDAG